MTAREFWTKWRREIMRGTFLFAAVLAVGLLVISGVHRARSGIRDLAFDLGGAGAHSGPRSEAAPWTYVTKLGNHQTLWIRNVRGDITVESGDGDSVLVSAVRSFNKSDPESVHFVTGAGPEGVAVCAVWGTQQGSCRPGTGTSMQSHDVGPNDVEVRFEIRLPRGVSADLETVTGDVQAKDVAGAVRAGSIQGDVSVTSTSGEVNAHTVTGDVSVRLPGVLDPRGVEAKTVTGDVRVELPPGVGATVSGHTVTGDVSNDFSLPVSGKFASHEMSGTIGKGGGAIRLETVTGDISLQHVTDAPVVAPVPPVPTVQPAPAARPRAAPRGGVATPPPGKP